MAGTESLWYKDAIFYEVYPRAFMTPTATATATWSG